MAGSGLLHGIDVIHAALPWWLGSGAVIVLGALVGSRFTNTTFRMLLGYLGAAFGSFAVAMAVATSFVLLVLSSIRSRSPTSRSRLRPAHRIR